MAVPLVVLVAWAQRLPHKQKLLERVAQTVGMVPKVIMSLVVDKEQQPGNLEKLVESCIQVAVAVVAVELCLAVPLLVVQAAVVPVVVHKETV